VIQSPKISVIMLTHNREKFLSRAIESILAQDFTDFELIIIDNNSMGNSGKIIAAYSKKDSRIRYFRRCDKSIGAGRNLGIEKSQGTFFTFVDDDDYAATDYLSFLHNLAAKHGADIAVCGSSYDINGKIKPKYTFDELSLCTRDQAVTNFLLRRYYNSGNATKLFRKNGEISEIRYPVHVQYDDIHTMYRFFAATGNQAVAVAAQGEAKYFVCRHGLNNSKAAKEHSTLSPEWLEEYLDAYRERTAYISRKMPNLSALAAWSEQSFMISMVEKINRYSISECAGYSELMRENLRWSYDGFLAAEWTRDFEREWMETYVK